MDNLIYKEEVYAVIGAAMEVHKELGHGFLEGVYHEAMEKELKIRDIDFQSFRQFDIFYKGNLLNKRYIADMVCFGKIIIEFKAVDFLSESNYLQVLNYLKCSEMKVGLLINFGSKSLEYKRVVLS